MHTTHIIFTPIQLKKRQCWIKSSLNGPAIILLLHERGKQDEKQKRRRRKKNMHLMNYN